MDILDRRAEEFSVCPLTFLLLEWLLTMQNQRSSMSKPIFL
jgi:hypothetical protein